MDVKFFLMFIVAENTRSVNIYPCDLNFRGSFSNPSSRFFNEQVPDHSIFVRPESQYMYNVHVRRHNFTPLNSLT